MVPILSVLLLLVCIYLFKINIVLMLIVALFGVVGISKVNVKSNIDWIDGFTSVGVLAVILTFVGGLIGAALG